VFTFNAYLRTKRPVQKSWDKIVVDHTCLQIGLEGKHSQKNQGQKGWDNMNVTTFEEILILEKLLTNFLEF